jgi:aconitate decarboxylase
VTIIREFADFITSTSYEQLPDSIVRRGKASLLDALGSMAFSQRLAHAARIVNLLTSDNGEYTVVGSRRKASLTDAVYLNGMLQVGYELTGSSWSIPAALLGTSELVERERKELVTGRELLLAFAVSNEVQQRINEWVGFGVERYVGWHSPAFHGCIGSAAAAARLLGLDAEQTANALSVAADMAGGGLIQSRNNSKRSHLGRAPQGGVLSALVAREGVVGFDDILEDPRWGYFRALRHGTEPMNVDDTIDSPTVFSGLGVRWDSDKPLSTKYYPFHSTAQTIIDNVKKLKAETGFGAADVASVAIHLTPFLHDHDQMIIPAKEIGHANFSFPYATALAIKYDPKRLTDVGGSGDVFVQAFADPEVAELQRKVSFVRSQQLDDENPYTMNTIVEIDLTDGRHLQTRTTYGHDDEDANTKRGSSHAVRFDAVTIENYETKFRNSVRKVLTEQAAGALVAAIDSLSDSDSTVRQIFDNVVAVGDGVQLLN